LSNIIKSRYVYVDGGEKKVIDSNERSEEFRLIDFFNRKKEIMDSSETETLTPDSDGFTQGIAATVVDIALEEEEEIPQKSPEEIIREAQEQAIEEAERIIKEAEEAAAAASEKMYEEAKSRGYAEGLKKGMEEADEMKRDLQETKIRQEEEFSEQLLLLEPQLADILTKLLEKMTGVLAEEHKQIIYHLVHNAIYHADNSKNFIIKISKEDYELMHLKIAELLTLVNPETAIEVVIDKELTKNQCMIETDTSIIDCSLDTQLNNLIRDIKLLSIQTE
jgi:flagellar assembly protein FliH